MSQAVLERQWLRGVCSSDGYEILFYAVLLIDLHLNLQHTLFIIVLA
jgi:hypothetical protein